MVHAWNTTDRWYKEFRMDIQSGKMKPLNGRRFFAKIIGVYREEATAVEGWPTSECHGETEPAAITAAETAGKAWIDQSESN